MKVIGVNGSARSDGNTAIIISKVFEPLNDAGINTELIQLADYEVRPCRACFGCKGRGNCVLKGDDFAELFAKLINSDGFILGSPVYSADVSAKMKAFLERGGVVVATNPGLTTVDTMNHFMLNKEMIIIGSTYWNMVYGREVGDVLNDDEGMVNMRNLGQNMAWVLSKTMER